MELEFKPIRKDYARDNYALSLLYRIRGIKERQTYGDSYEGSRAGFAVKMGGGDTLLRFMNGDKKKREGLFGWL